MSEPDRAFVYDARCISVIDGDTFVADVDLGFGAHIWIHVRLRGVDTPELPSQPGLRAKEYLRRLLAGRPLRLQSYKDRMSFARWVCDVWIEEEPLADRIIESGHGEVYGRA